MNSCEGETSESANKDTNGETSDKNQNIVNQILKESQPKELSENNDQAGPTENQISDCSETIPKHPFPTSPNSNFPEPSVSSSAGSIGFKQPKYDVIRVNSLEFPAVIKRDTVLETCPVTSQPLPERAESQLQIEIEQQRARRPSIGPPPSYSFVMKQKRKGLKPSIPSQLIERVPPPPTYSGVGIPSENEGLGRICIMPSYAEPRWRSHPQPAICPRCGILVFTTTHTHDSIATHMAALALCLFGCWPCCFLPYCMSSCKNTYHHCPFCQSFLGSYTPW